MRILTSLGVVAAFAGSARANAFLLNEFDARAVGRGDTGVATDYDPSSIYYNVGGLATTEGTRVTIGGSLIAPIASFTDAATGTKTDSTTPAQVIPGVFASSRLNHAIAVGVGFYTPFGLAVDWPASSPQADVVREIALHTFFITPAVGLNLGKWVPGLTFGAGLDIVPATVELKQDIYFGTNPAGSAHLAGSATGFGARVGAMYRPEALRQLSVGLTWRSQVAEAFTGTGAFTAPAPFRAMLPPDGSVKVCGAATATSSCPAFVLPQQLSGGVAYRPLDALEIEADVIWTNWSSFKALDIVLPGMTTINQPKNYKDTVTLRTGIEYGLPQYKTAVRAGFIYDPSPIPATTLDATLPDVDRYIVTLGASYQLKIFDIHLGLLWVTPQKRTTAPDPNAPEYKGTFDVQAIVGSIGVSGKIM
jgi:long-chain fatty acid transport protein